MVMRIYSFVSLLAAVNCSIMWFVVAFHAVYSSCCLWVTHVDGKPIHLRVWLLKCRMHRRLYSKECAGVSWPAGHGKDSVSYLEKNVCLICSSLTLKTLLQS